MGGEIIRFEQAALIHNEKDKFEVYYDKLREIIRFFAKNTLLQFLQIELMCEVTELTRYYVDKDYSKFLEDKTLVVFEKFEELQNDKEMGEFQKVIGEAIKLINEKNII